LRKNIGTVLLEGDGYSKVRKIDFPQLLKNMLIDDNGNKREKNRRVAGLLHL
jgi:hypothetical protein